MRVPTDLLVGGCKGLRYRRGDRRRGLVSLWSISARRNSHAPRGMAVATGAILASSSARALGCWRRIRRARNGDADSAAIRCHCGRPRARDLFSGRAHENWRETGESQPCIQTIEEPSSRTRTHWGSRIGDCGLELQSERLVSAHESHPGGERRLLARPPGGGRRKHRQRGARPCHLSRPSNAKRAGTSRRAHCCRADLESNSRGTSDLRPDAVALL